MQKAKPHKFFKRKESKHEQKQVKKPREFPNIYRFITENIRISKKWLGIGIFFLGLCVFAASAGFQAYRHYQDNNRVLLQRSVILAKISFWQQVIDKKKGYRDGYFQLAILSYQLGRSTEAKAYLVQAMKLDPNFDDGKKLEEVLNKE